jgi:hypothetical protein
MSVALEPDLDERVRQSADRSGKTLSEWLTEAAKAKLLVELGEEAELQRKMRGLDTYLDEYEAEHGAFTNEVDAIVALLARSGDLLYTSDPGDLRKLCGAAGIKAVVIGC